ncbi:hypothetical protein PHSY_001238 [Pseudozyma hubeiensis SY62]|uniref:Uncharacterized protein n=1 Tax=Pseudozyma hubeiensis (strain SY62) TaxID=1305764 RepID=R9NY47_PSEHS|nr:hypothetical protein PHSY_001238 [Pseudozyma hubeiensis SY62]GAC93673.1 hypothetical protein PHSY_001238 [Pseudozyma hubeiensis SY62]
MRGKCGNKGCGPKTKTRSSTAVYGRLRSSLSESILQSSGGLCQCSLGLLSRRFDTLQSGAAIALRQERPTELDPDDAGIRRS